MKNPTAYSSRFQAHVNNLRAQFDVPTPERVDPITQIVIAFLMWETTSDLADDCLARVRETFFDFNELRVANPKEFRRLLGRRYPRGAERADLLLATLKEIHTQQHQLSLSHLISAHPEVICQYFTQLQTPPPYVKAQVMLCCFDIPIVPMDGQLRAALIQNDVIDKSANLDELQVWCARQIPHDQILETHLLLQGWVEDQA